MSFLIALITSLNLYAYNSSKCKSFMYKQAGYLNVFFLSTSTGQYISSTSECSMIGEVDHDQKVFLADNLDKIKLDVLKGGGEYLLAYANIIQCNQNGAKFLLKESAYKLKKTILNLDAEEVYDELEYVIQSTPSIKSNCLRKPN